MLFWFRQANIICTISEHLKATKIPHPYSAIDLIASLGPEFVVIVMPGNLNKHPISIIPAIGKFVIIFEQPLSQLTRS